jgi:hypothetical protein
MSQLVMTLVVPTPVTTVLVMEYVLVVVMTVTYSIAPREMVTNMGAVKHVVGMSMW